MLQCLPGPHGARSVIQTSAILMISTLLTACPTSSDGTGSPSAPDPVETAPPVDTPPGDSPEDSVSTPVDSGVDSSPSESDTEAPPPDPTWRPFSDDSLWNTPIPAEPALDPNSDDYIGFLWDRRQSDGGEEPCCRKTWTVSGVGTWTEDSLYLHAEPWGEASYYAEETDPERTVCKVTAIRDCSGCAAGECGTTDEECQACTEECVIGKGEFRDDLDVEQPVVLRIPDGEGQIIRGSPGGIEFQPWIHGETPGCDCRIAIVDRSTTPWRLFSGGQFDWIPPEDVVGIPEGITCDYTVAGGYTLHTTRETGTDWQTDTPCTEDSDCNAEAEDPPKGCEIGDFCPLVCRDKKHSTTGEKVCAHRNSEWARATRIPNYAGLILREEMLAGEIRHALLFYTAYSSDRCWWPARASDGHMPYALDDDKDGEPDYAWALPQGARIQLDPSIDADAICTKTENPDMARGCEIVVRALQQYGAQLVDTGSGAHGLHGELFLNPDGSCCDHGTGTWGDVPFFDSTVIEHIPTELFRLLEPSDWTQQCEYLCPDYTPHDGGVCTRPDDAITSVADPYVLQDPPCEGTWDGDDGMCH